MGASVLLPITTNYGDSVTVIPRDDGSALGFGTDLGAGFQLRWHGDTPRGSCDPNAIEQQHHQAHQGGGDREGKMRSSMRRINHWLPELIGISGEPGPEPDEPTGKPDDVWPKPAFWLAWPALDVPDCVAVWF